jgi:hypothetical protein
VSLGFSRIPTILQFVVLAAFLAILGGCGPELSQSDLGTVLKEVPQVAGADKPYVMPQLGPPVKQKPGETDPNDE